MLCNASGCVCRMWIARQGGPSWAISRLDHEGVISSTIELQRLLLCMLFNGTCTTTLFPSPSRTLYAVRSCVLQVKVTATGCTLKPKPKNKYGMGSAAAGRSERARERSYVRDLSYSN